MSVLAKDIAIRVSNLSKLFRIYQKPADMFWELVTSKPRYQSFCALSDISFEIKRGQIVGFIGRNGAGKSTLLKLITGTLDKTSGEIEVNGRISSILELGIGFNPEYTGRDNIYLGGLMVGLTRAEIDRKVDWIIEFSELEDVIDQTFKTYSTGMQARLTFSTAVCIEPDILIVDEVLSVGDAKFQRKSFKKIEEFRQAGRTILFVSHDLNTVNHICNEAYLLEHGRMIEEGSPKRVTKAYEEMLFGSDGKNVDKQDQIEIETQAKKVEELRKVALQKIAASSNPGTEARYGDGRAEILEFGILNKNGEQVTILRTGEEYVFFSRVLFFDDNDDVHLGYGIKDVKGVYMFGVNTRIGKVPVPPQKKGDILEGQVTTRIWLAPGHYFLTVGAWGLHASSHYDRRVDALSFRVTGNCLLISESLVNLEARIKTKQLARIV